MKKQSKGSKIRQAKSLVKSQSSWNGLKKILQLLERAEVSEVSTPINSDVALEILNMQKEI